MNDQQYSPAGFRLLPPVVKNLLIINGLFFLATVSLQNAFGIDLDTLLGLHCFKSDLFQPYQLVTYMFLHADFGHILWNMFALWMFGYLLENVWGPKRFLTYYLITGIGAGIIQIIVTWWTFLPAEAAMNTYIANPNIDAFVSFVNQYSPHSRELFEKLKIFLSEWNNNPMNQHYALQSTDYIAQLWQDQISTPTIGASGAVYGILLAFGMMFPNMLVFIYFLFPIKAKWIVILYGAIELFSGISSNPNDNVAHFAHLGGMLFGFFLILFWKKKSVL
ncbi:MAG: rhomboid family intramembrane serine protease [bacterium]